MNTAGKNRNRPVTEGEGGDSGRYEHCREELNHCYKALRG